MNAGEGKPADEVVVTAPAAAATVTFYTADGSAIAATPLTPRDTSGGVLGETPATRITP